MFEAIVTYYWKGEVAWQRKTHHIPAIGDQVEWEVNGVTTALTVVARIWRRQFSDQQPVDLVLE